MKLLKNTIRLLIIALAFGCFNAVSAMTPTWESGAKFTRGVGNTCYFVSSSALGYTNSINAAADNWSNPGWWNPISMIPVSSNYATHVDFYAIHGNQNIVLVWGAYGYTSFWDENGSPITLGAEAPNRSYFYTEINFNLDKSMSYDYRTSKHELGHAFGLRHSDRYSIMYPDESGYVSTVQYADNEAINYLY